MLGWGEVLQKIEIDTENFDLHRSIPVDEDVSSLFGVEFLNEQVSLCRH